MSEPIHQPQISGEDQPGFLARLMAGVRSFLGGGGGEGTLRASLEEVIDEHDEAQGDEELGAQERSMLFNVLGYGSLRTDDIMVPRIDIVAVEAGLEFDKLLKVFADAAHSRLPVYRENMDEIVGMVHVKDVVIHLGKTEANGASPMRIEDIMREVLFVAPSMKLMDLLARMRAKRTHMAIVVDEYGGTDGLVTIENLVEQIVGDIEDEHDDEERLVLTPVRAGVFDTDARLSVEELEQVLSADLLPENLDDDIDTVGGLVATLEGRVPGIGEVIEHDQGYRFEVLDADPRRIKKVRIYSSEDQ